MQRKGIRMADNTEIIARSSKRRSAVLAAAAAIAAVFLMLALTGCGSSGIALEDGQYSAKFTTDSSMFHVNEANNGKGVLTVEDGKATIHVSLVSKNIEHMFVGTAQDAQKDGAVLLDPTTDTVTYSDGMTEEVYGFDIPVSVLDQDFDLAIIGAKGKWYDHKVSVSDPQPIK